MAWSTTTSLFVGHIRRLFTSSARRQTSHHRLFPPSQHWGTATAHRRYRNCCWLYHPNDRPVVVNSRRRSWYTTVVNVADSTNGTSTSTTTTARSHPTSQNDDDCDHATTNNNDIQQKQQHCQRRHRFMNRTVIDTLHDVLKEFMEADDAATATSLLEPNVSTVQLLALALELPWDTGFQVLQRLLQHQIQQRSQPPPELRGGDNNNVGDDTTLPLAFRRLSLSQSERLDSYIQRRLQYEPLQYICGQWDFLQYTLTIRSPLLCPRPETEELVQLVVNDIQYGKSTTTTDEIRTTPGPPIVRILDVGCGTGCIGIALADQIPSSIVTAIDVEPIAITTANENAKRVLCHDEGKTSSKTHLQRYNTQLISAQDYCVPHDSSLLFHVVVSNPPYILQDDMTALDPGVARYESSTALYGGSADGMEIIRCIVRQLPRWCHPNAICWMEVDPTHPRLLQEWLSSTSNEDAPEADTTTGLRVQFVSVHQDLSGRDRFVKLRVV